jgi:hypothetical protein
MDPKIFISYHIPTQRRLIPKDLNLHLMLVYRPADSVLIFVILRLIQLPYRS